MADANDMLMSGGIPWLSFKEKGVTYTGKVMSFTARQSRDFESGDLAWWDKEQTQPKEEVVITLQTDLFDPEVDGDTGARQLVVPKGSARMAAVRSAIRSAGASGIEVGGTITITYTGDKPNTKNPKLNGIKQFDVTYVAPGLTDQAAQDALDALTK
jgi:hypothetical protein